MKNTHFALMPTLCVATAILICFLPLIAAGQDMKDAGTYAAAAADAQKALAAYQQNVVNDKNYGKYGFGSVGEARSSQLGAPLPILILGLDQLKAYNPGTGYKPSIAGAQMLWYPVQVAGQTRAKLEMIRKNNQWVAGEFGSKVTADIVAKAQAALPDLLAAKNVPAGYQVALVKAPAVYGQFLYVQSTAGDFMVPALLNPERLNLQNNTVYTADEVLTKLKAAAVDIDPKKVM